MFGRVFQRLQRCAVPAQRCAPALQRRATSGARVSMLSRSSVAPMLSSSSSMMMSMGARSMSTVSKVTKANIQLIETLLAEPMATEKPEFPHLAVPKGFTLDDSPNEGVFKLVREMPETGETLTIYADLPPRQDIFPFSEEAYDEAADSDFDPDDSDLEAMQDEVREAQQELPSDYDASKDRDVDPFESDLEEEMRRKSRKAAGDDSIESSGADADSEGEGEGESDSDFDEEQEALLRSVNGRATGFGVILSRANSPNGLLIDCVSDSGVLLINGVVYLPDSAKTLSQTAQGMFEHRMLYDGPSMQYCTENLQTSLKKFLEARGVNDEFGDFVHQYRLMKEMRNIGAWVANLTNFLSARP